MRAAPPPGSPHPLPESTSAPEVVTKPDPPDNPANTDSLNSMPASDALLRLDFPAGLRISGADTHVLPQGDLPGPGQVTMLDIMTTPSASDSKPNLSRHLREVPRGGEVQVLDCGVPVAKFAPRDTDDDGGARERSIDTGLLRQGNGSAAAILIEPPLELPVSLSDALTEERADRV